MIKKAHEQRAGKIQGKSALVFSKEEKKGKEWVFSSIQEKEA